MPTSSMGSLDTHFHPRQFEDYDVLRHRPHKTAMHLLNALSATAVFRIWPSLMFSGAWATMVVLVNLKTDTKMEFPNTMITVLGVLLGLTLSYRTSSAYEKYSEGRKMWSQITLGARQWARMVWLHCPDTVLSEPPADPNELAQDIARGIVEKKTIVQMGLAFAVAVKHYLRGEEGIYYEDLYHLVCFMPSFDMPSAMPAHNANMSPGLPSLTGPRGASYPADSPLTPKTPRSANGGPKLRPAEDPPQFRLSDLWPRRRRAKANSGGDHRSDCQPGESDLHSGRGQNVPLEIIMFMSSWVSELSRRKTIDVPTGNALQLALNQLSDALVALERILTTPIPWSYNAHIWEVAWIYILALPFQLYASKFGWATVPATVITTHIVMGYASIAEEIENPFNFDKNDLNLGYFCREIIAKELDAITGHSVDDPAESIFTPANRPLGCHHPSADQLAEQSISELRQRLAARSEFSRLRPSSTTFVRSSSSLVAARQDSV